MYTWIVENLNNGKELVSGTQFSSFDSCYSDAEHYARALFNFDTVQFRIFNNCNWISTFELTNEGIEELGRFC